MATPDTNKPAAPAPAPVPVAPAAPAWPPAPEGMVNVTVDGRHTTVKLGANLIEAAKTVQVEIPYFCYHPRLSIAGQCRMCLVETSDGPGRLVAGCQVRVKEGLAINTATPLAQDNQRSCMEFHLVNHPVDCPICDQSGECKLQDYYMQYDAKEARIQTYKVNKPKRKVFGPLVVYDGERCILCTRCVRFMNEIAQEPQIAMVGRGDHSEIDTVPGKKLDSKYSGNTVDLCPVGALLNRDFRFASRVWYLDATRTVCDGCANGCNVSADSRADAVYRLLPKRNEEVNQVWLCDDGRTSYHRTMDGRIEAPRAGRGDTGEWPTVAAAIDAVGEILKPLIGQAGVAIGLSATLSNEEAYAAAVFAREVLGATRLFQSGRPAGQGDDFLIRTDKNPNTHGVKLAAKAAGLELLAFEALAKAIESGSARHVVLFGAELPTDENAFARKLAGLSTLIVFGATRSPVTDAATYLLPLATHLEADGSFVNYYGRLQRFRRAIAPRHDALPLWRWVSKLSTALAAAWQFETAQEAFGLLAARGGEAFTGLSLDGLPETGVVLPGLAPKDYPKRAPRPATAD